MTIRSVCCWPQTKSCHQLWITGTCSHQKRVHIASSDVANVETDIPNLNVEVDVASSMLSLWMVDTVSRLMTCQRMDSLWYGDILWQNLLAWNSVTFWEFCDKVVSKILWQIGIFLTNHNMLTCLFFVNKSTIIYLFFSERIAKYSIMLSTGVVGEHFSVAHPSHGQVGFIPGVVKLSHGDLVSLDLVFPFQVIITACDSKRKKKRKT